MTTHESGDAELSHRLSAQDVIVSYANGIDDRDFEAYRSCFQPDVVLTGFAPEPVCGVEAWLEFVEKALEPFAHTQHMLGPPKIAVDGDRARMRTDLQASHFYREPAGRIFTLWGVYRTVLVRDAGWRIAEHHLDVWHTRRDAS